MNSALSKPVDKWLLRKERISFRHYFFALIVSLLSPLLVASLQSLFVIFRNARLEPAFLYYASGGFFNYLNWVEKSWLWMSLVAASTFLILTLFLKFPILRRIALLSSCFGWTYLFSGVGR